MLIETQNTDLKTATATNMITTAVDAKPQNDAGLIAGTLVETAAGWRRVELLRAGDRVHTYDGGLRQLRRVERAYYGAENGGYELEQILHVPGGVLDNCEALFLMPEQFLMIESQIAQELLGTLAVLIPGSALLGFQGITAHQPEGLLEAISLGFDDEEVVFANSGMLTHCASKGAVASGSEFFKTLDHWQAKALIHLMGKNSDTLDQAMTKFKQTERAALTAA